MTCAECGGDCPTYCVLLFGGSVMKQFCNAEHFETWARRNDVHYYAPLDSP